MSGTEGPWSPTQLRQRAKYEVRRGRRFVGRARLYAPVLGWRTTLRSLWADEYVMGADLVIDWPGYAAPFRLRPGGSDLHTFVHVIAMDGYRPDFAEPTDVEVIVDAGGNVGLSALWYANRFPNATIYSIEPEAANFECLQRNVSAISRIVPIQAAVWSEQGVLSVTATKGGSWAFRVDVDAAGLDPGAQTIEAITVDSLIRDHGITHIDILKIDIEGSEKEVFEASAGWIGIVDMIAVELHDRFKDGCRAAFDEATRDFSIRSTRDEETFVRRPEYATASGAG